MSYPYSGPASDRNELQFELLLPRNIGTPATPALDGDIDLALRSVPLPKGLLTRLGWLAHSMPEDAADERD